MRHVLMFLLLVVFATATPPAPVATDPEPPAPVPTPGVLEPPAPVPTAGPVGPEPPAPVPTAAPVRPPAPFSPCLVSEYLCTAELQAQGDNCIVGHCISKPVEPTAKPTPAHKPTPGHSGLTSDRCHSAVESCVPSNLTGNHSGIDNFVTMMKCVKTSIASQPSDSSCANQFEGSVLDACAHEFHNCYSQHQKRMKHHQSFPWNGTDTHHHSHPSVNMDGPCPMKFIRMCIAWTGGSFSKSCSAAIQDVQDAVAMNQLPSTVADVQEPMKTLLQYDWVWGAAPTFDPQLPSIPAPSYQDYSPHHFHHPWRWVAAAVGGGLALIAVCCYCARRRRRAIGMRQEGSVDSGIPVARVYSLPYTALADQSAIPMAQVVRVPVPPAYVAPVAQPASHIPTAVPVYYN